MADSMKTVKDLLVTGLKYTLDLEQKAGKVAQTMAQATESPEAKEIFEQSVEKSQQYAQRIEQAFQKVGSQAKTEDNHLVDAMMKEVEGMIQSSQKGPVRDAAGAFLAALAVHAPTVRHSAASLRALSGRLREAAAGVAVTIAIDERCNR